MLTGNRFWRRLAVAAMLLLCAGFAGAQTGRVVTVRIIQTLGVDPQVDYAGLTQFGPWDDRNYTLTAADIGLLSKHETDAIVPIPAFYRVEMRRANPNLPKIGPAQYPRSALNGFLAKYSGYMIDKIVYTSINALGNNRYEVKKKRFRLIPRRSRNSSAARNASPHRPAHPNRRWRSIRPTAIWSSPAPTVRAAARKYGAPATAA